MKWLSIRDLVSGLAGIALFGTVVASAVQGPFDPNSEMIFVGDKALVLMPPVVAVKGAPTAASWSYNGKWLFMESVDAKLTPDALAKFMLGGAVGGPPTTAEALISFFDVDRRDSHVVWRGKVDGSRISQIQWLPGGNAVLFVRDEVVPSQDGPPSVVQSIYAAIPGRNTVQRLMKLSESQFAILSSHPLARGGVIGIQDLSNLRRTVEAGAPPETSEWTATWVADNGQLGSSFKVEGRLPNLQWGARGEGPVFHRRTVEPRTKQVTTATVLLDFQAGSARSIREIKMADSDLSVLGFKADFGTTASAIETSQAGRRSIWLISHDKTERQYALVAADATRRELSPAGNAVYYETLGVGLVRPIASLPKDLALKALEAAERTKAMNDAKQAALALIMYAADNDDMLPPGSGDWISAVNPYLKNQDVLGNFAYTFTGGSMADIKNPAETELGYRQGPGGRAVAYADGHVKWIPDK